MSIPHVMAPRLLLFTCAARVLYRSSQALLVAGSLEADLPVAIEEARQQAEIKLAAGLATEGISFSEAEEGILMDSLLLTPPPEVLGLIQNWIDDGSGPDLEGFLAAADPTQTGILRLPKLVVCPEALKQVLERISFEPEDLATLQATWQEMEARLSTVAAQQQMDPQPLRSNVAASLAQLSPEALLLLVQDYGLEESMQPEPDPPPQQNTLNVVGPLLFLEIADHLLGSPTLTPDQQLDLQTNRGKAEAKLRAMQKLGRIEDPEAQKQQIQAWIQQFPTEQLLQKLDRLFEIDAETDSDQTP